MVKQIFSRLLLIILLADLAACAGVGGHKPERQIAEKVFSASGYGKVVHDSRLTAKQSRLLAEQSAKMNAYRQLAAQLYREKLKAGATVGRRVLAEEIYRIYFDTYLREAKVTDSRTFGATMQITLALTVTDRFYYCISGDVTTVEACLQQDNKIPFTRIGYQTAELKSVNLHCMTADCGELFHVKGFNQEKSAFDRGMLDAGLADGEWIVNSAGRLLINGLFFEVLSQ